MKNIMVISGSGIETSKTVAERLSIILSDRGIAEKADVTITELKDFDENIKQSDLVVSTMFIDNEKYKVPVFNAMPFLTGIRLNEEVDKIVCAL